MRAALRVAAAALLVAIGAMIVAEGRFRAPGPGAEEVLVWIPSGAGLARAARILEDAGVVRRRSLFVWGTWLRGAGGDLRAGEYRIAAGASMEAVLAKLRSGEVVQRKLLVPEGATVGEVLRLLAEAEHLDGEVAEPPAEGWVAPDTYFYVRGEQREAILRRMVDSQRRILAELWPGRAEDLPVATPDGALTLASIVEKETALAEERSRVAGVFVNRLRRGMRLQSDPTVIYDITRGRQPLGRALARSDLDSPGPYNTYRNGGLPPGPIASPGRASIEAALHPADTGELYFVADGSGGHAFARTLREHNRNVARWRKMRER